MAANDLVYGETELLSSVRLQVFLYFHTYFLPVWFIATLLASAIQTQTFFETTLLAALYILTAALEIVRLYFGYMGNLLERVAALSGFVVLTVLFEIPLVSVILALTSLHLQLAFNILLLIFLFFELVFGWTATVYISREQAARFVLYNQLAQEQTSVPRRQSFVQTTSIR
eukprot:m.263617 g.263617  ORF g.263617 m.263617 type:complete len:171 (-) comp54649_c0_seq7:1378-1890(-)